MLPLALLLAVLSHSHPALAQSTPPRIDFSRLGSVGLAGSFAGLSLFTSPSFNATSNPLASTFLTRSPSDGSLTSLGTTEDGGEIYAACALDEKVYVAGSFAQLGGQTAANVASYDPSSSTFSALAGDSLNGPVRALYCDAANNLLWVGGAFTSPSAGVALYSLTNSSWLSVPFSSLAGSVLSISPSPSSQSLFFTGQFLTAFASNSSGTNNTYGNNPNVPYSGGATPYSSSLVPVPLGEADLTAEPATTQAGFGDIASVLCPAGPDGAGDTWLAQDGSVAQVTVRAYRNEGVSGLRLGNTFVQGRGTTSFTLTTIPDNQVMPLTYLDPSTNTTSSCPGPCPLLTDPSIPYQDFIFASSPSLTITGFQLTLNTFTGAGAGLHLLQLLSSGSFASFVPGLDTQSCFSPGPSTVSESGIWDLINVTTSTAATLQPVLQSTFPISTPPSQAPALNLSVYTSAVGFYTAYLFVPGCVELQDCALRTTVAVTLSPGGGLAPVTQQVDQRVQTDTLAQIYRGPLYPAAPTFSIPVELTLAPQPAGTGDGSNYDIVADQVQFVLTAAPNGTAEGSVGQGVPGYNLTAAQGGGEARGFGVFEWPLGAAGVGGVNASGVMPNGSETAVDAVGQALYTALVGVASTYSTPALSSFGNTSITALAASSSNASLFLAGSFSLPSIGTANIALWTGSSLLALPSGGLNGPVAALVLDSGAGQLYVGGEFTGLAQGGAEGYGGVARYDAGKGEWATLGGGLDGPVRGLALNGSSLVVVGNFTSPTSSASGLAIWSTSSAAWVSPEGFVLGAMSMISTDAAYVAGNVASVAGYAADGWAQLSADGNGNPVLAPVSAVQLQSISGSSGAGTTRRRAAKRSAASEWLRRVFEPRQSSASPAALPPALPAPAPAVLAGTFWTNGSDPTVILGGNFSLSSSGQTADAVALYDESSGAVRGLKGGQLNGTVRALLVSGSTLFVGGEFGQQGEQTDGLAMYDLGADQFVTAFQALQPTSGSNVVVRSITAIPSSPAIIIVAGSFASAGSLPCEAICAWDTSAQQWNALGEGISGEVTSVAYAGSSTGYMVVGGSLASAQGGTASVMQYSIGNLTWEVLGTGSDLPGPVTALAVDDYNSSSIFAAGRTSDNSAAFFSHWDGTQWTAVDNTLAGTSSVSQIAVVPLLDAHGQNALVESDRMLLVSGSLASNSFGNVSSALFDGQGWYPYLSAVTATGSQGSIASLFYSAASITYGITNYLSVGIVVLISLAIGFGIVLLLFVLGLIIAVLIRRSEETPLLPIGDGDEDDASSMHHPSSLLEHVQAATRATLLGESAFAAAGAEKGRSTEGSHGDHLGDDSMESDEPPLEERGGPAVGAAEGGREAYARYSFEAADDHELPVRAGTQLEILDDRDESWWLARDPSTGRQGIVPAAYFY